MSAAESEADATEVALSEEFHAAIADAGERIASVLVPACPTTAFLDALRADVERAIDDRESVPYPELADPEAYWEATVKPQSRSLRESVVAIVEWLEQRVITTMEVAEADLKALVDTAAADPGPDPGALRAMISDEIDRRCIRLHHQMAEVLTILPPTDELGAARRRAEEAIRVQATDDVASLKTAYLRDAGGDEAHQRFAEQQWSETFGSRVAHRQSMLAAQPPWRHQEFALVGYERARAEIERVVEETAVRLQAPLREVPALLLQRYDAALSLSHS